MLKEVKDLLKEVFTDICEVKFKEAVRLAHIEEGELVDLSIVELILHNYLKLVGEELGVL